MIMITIKLILIKIILFKRDTINDNNTKLHQQI